MKNKYLKKRLLLALAVVLLFFYCSEKTQELYLDDLDLSTMVQGWGEPVKNKNLDQQPLKIGSKTFERGIATHTNSNYCINLKGVAKKFTAFIGVSSQIKLYNPGTDNGTVEFFVYVDEKPVYQSGMITYKDEPKEINIDLEKAQSLRLFVDKSSGGTHWDHAIWAMAKIEMEGKAKTTPEPMFKKTPVQDYILSPVMPDFPQINSPAVYGSKTGKPFLFKIPVTGKLPITYNVSGLPTGLLCDKNTGIISGIPNQNGFFEVSFDVSNSAGKANKKMQLQIADKIALTPPMGWNSWNIFGLKITEAKIKAMADAMVSSRLIDYGWSYILIDDGWQGERQPSGEIAPNANFPNMKALADYVHAKGLKLGIYSSPGDLTCGGFEGSKGFELQDAQTYAKWGIDYLKYDWCSCKDTNLQAPYTLMRDALNQQNRNICYSFCQYGMGDVWKWAESAGANLWRTTGDISDVWGAILDLGFGQNGLEQYAKPGHWNDPDMLIVGKLGWGNTVRNTKLNANEQYTHITLWTMLAAPMILGCDLTQLDDFTFNLLSNREVLEVNQDELGKQGSKLEGSKDHEVWVKKLSNGKIALAIFNLSWEDKEIEFDLNLLKIGDQLKIRDLWKQKDLILSGAKLKVKVVAHGCTLMGIVKEL